MAYRTRKQPNSPKSSNHEQLNSQQTEMQFILDKLLKQSARRQENYISLIKQHQEKLYMQSEQYLQSLKKYEKFIEQKLAKNSQNKYKQYSHINKMFSKLNEPINKYNKVQFTQQIAATCQLHCQIKFIYLTPLLIDYLNETYPKNIIIKAQIPYPHKSFSLRTQVITDEETQQAIFQNILNGYPFELLYQQNSNPKLDFTLREGPHLAYAIKFMTKCLLNVEIYDQETQFLYCEGKLPLHQLLYYSSNREQRNEKINFYKEGKLVSYVLIQFINEIKPFQKSLSHKIQSQNPIQIKGSKSLKGDSQSRIIQRINKFKVTNATLVPQLNRQNNDVDLVMHMKRKQLQSIMEYKSSHKQQMMDKIMQQALEKYKTIICELGQIKFIQVKFTNTKNKIEKIILKTYNQVAGKREELKEGSMWTLIQPEKLKNLLKFKNFSHKPTQFIQYEYNYFYDQSQKSLWVPSGDTISLCYRFLLYSISNEDRKILKNNLNYELQVQFISEFGQLISKQQVKVKVCQPINDHTFNIYNYPSLIDELSVTIPNRQCTQFYTTFNKIQYFLDKNTDQFKFKIKHPQIVNHKTTIEYIFIYDNNLINRQKCYRIIVNTFPEVITKSLLIGQIGVFKLELKGNQISKELQHRIKVVTSQPTICVASCQGQTQFNVKKDHIYMIDLKVQSFKDINPLKIVIQFIDKINHTIIKKCLLRIPIQFKPYKNQYKIYLTLKNPQTIFKFSLANKSNQQLSYRLYSSNKSIINPPTSLIKLYAHQIIDVDLKIIFRKNQAMIDETFKHVILVSYDGRQLSSYLFQIEIGY